ncbi:hypothetical protein [Paenibacillus sp. GYB003]
MKRDGHDREWPGTARERPGDAPLVEGDRRVAGCEEVGYSGEAES